MALVVIRRPEAVARRARRYLSGGVTILQLHAQGFPASASSSSFDAALHRDHRRAGADLPRSANDPANQPVSLGRRFIQMLSGAPLAAYRGMVLHFRNDPGEGDTRTRCNSSRTACSSSRMGESKRLAMPSSCCPAPRERNESILSRLILPGFVDAHIHYPQTDVIASHGMQLPDWLERCTYPVEMASLTLGARYGGVFLTSCCAWHHDRAKVRDVHAKVSGRLQSASAATCDGRGQSADG